jgi:hypothetical protein
MDRLAEGQSRPRFGQLAGRSVFNTRTDYHQNSILVLTEPRHSYPVRIPCTPLVFGRGPAMLAAARFGNRARAVGLACSPRMQTPSPTTKLLAGMPASKAAAERVFSALPLAVTVLRDSGGSFIQ